jgi:hypothetical protein
LLKILTLHRIDQMKAFDGLAQKRIVVLAAPDAEYASREAAMTDAVVDC